MHRNSLISWDMPKETPKPRGTPVTVPSWWMEKVRALVGRGDYAAVAEKLHKASPHSADPPSAGKVQRFTWNGVTTVEMVEAFCAAYRLTPFIYVARTEEEAAALHAVSKAFRGRLAGPDRVKLATADLDAAEISREFPSDGHDSHTQEVGSRDAAGDGRKGRPVGRTRASPQKR